VITSDVGSLNNSFNLSDHFEMIKVNKKCLLKIPFILMENYKK
jgi:hypothetical protein